MYTINYSVKLIKHGQVEAFCIVFFFEYVHFYFLFFFSKSMHLIFDVTKMLLLTLRAFQTRFVGLVNSVRSALCSTELSLLARVPNTTRFECQVCAHTHICVRLPASNARITQISVVSAFQYRLYYRRLEYSKALKECINKMHITVNYKKNNYIITRYWYDW